MTKHLLLALTVWLASLAAACGDDSSHDDMDGMDEGQVEPALAAMERILAAYPDRIGFHMELDHWGLALPNDYKVEWTANTASNPADVAFVLPAQVLIDAGVDPQALVASGWLYQDAVTGGEMGDSPALLIRPFDLDAENAGPSGEDSAAAAFERLLRRFPAKVGFHEELQHHGLDLGNGNKFEWTDDLAAGDADIAMVFEARPLIAAGADVAALQAAGWLHAEATGGEHATPELLILPVALP